MPRQKTKHAQIPSERVRKSTYKRRLDSLFKKASELSILCGIDVAIIVHDPDEGRSTLWPSQGKVMEGVTKFFAIPERERHRKMVVHDKFLMDKLQDMTQDFMKLQKKNQETEMGFLMNQLIDGASIDELDVSQLSGLGQFVEEKLKKLQSRSEELDEELQGQLSRLHYHHSFERAVATMAVKGQENSLFDTTKMEDTREDRWFGNALPSIQNNHGFFRGIDAVAAPNEVVRTFFEGNQDQALGDFGRAWPTFFSP